MLLEKLFIINIQGTKKNKNAKLIIKQYIRIYTKAVDVAPQFPIDSCNVAITYTKYLILSKHDDKFLNFNFLCPGIQ